MNYLISLQISRFPSVNNNVSNAWDPFSDLQGDACKILGLVFGTWVALPEC